MRIVLVISKGELGGAQTHVAELCAALRERCVFLVLIGGAERSALAGALDGIGIANEALPRLANTMSPAGIVASVREVAARASAWHADVIHVHSAVAAAVGRLAGVVASIPVVYTVHGFAFKPQVPALRRMCAFAAERLLAPLSHHVICVSPAERQLALKLGIPTPRLSVISNGLSDTAARAVPDAEPATLIMVARMAAPKRQDLVIEALRLLQDQGVRPPTVLAGGGPLLAPCRQLAAGLPHVSFCDDVADVGSRLARSQVFILASDHEGQPISVLEAMRAGLPVIASDLPGIRGQISDGVEGLLTANDPAAIARAVARLVTDARLRARMGAAARRRFESDFSAARMAERVVQVYARAAAHAGLALQG